MRPRTRRLRDREDEDEVEEVRAGVTSFVAPIEAARMKSLTPVQRQTIYRTIVRERVSPARPTVEYRVGTRVPESVQLYSVPQEIAVEVPAIRSYKYMVVNDRVVLIDPATSEVVAELAE